MGEAAIRHPKRGKAHRPTSWLHFGIGASWEGKRVTGTACGFGDGGTVRAMTEEIDIDRVDMLDRCRKCWPADREQATNHPGDVLGDAAEVASEGERDE